MTEPGADREQRGSDGDVVHGLREKPVGPAAGRRARLLIAMGLGSREGSGPLHVRDSLALQWRTEKAHRGSRSAHPMR